MYFREVAITSAGSIKEIELLKRRTPLSPLTGAYGNGAGIVRGRFKTKIIGREAHESNSKPRYNSDGSPVSEESIAPPARDQSNASPDTAAHCRLPGCLPSNCSRQNNHSCPKIC